MNRRIATLTVAIIAIIGAVLAIGFTYPAAASLGLARPTLAMQRGGPPSGHWNASLSGNVTIDANQAKALVQSSIANFKIGTVSSDRIGWTVPIEDAKGVVAVIQVSQVNASTADQAKSLVQASLQEGWKAGDPKLMRTIYDVPLLNSNTVMVAHVRVDGRTGSIITQPSTILTVTSQQAKAIATSAIAQFQVRNVNDTGSMWTVSITYQGKVVMIVQLAKLNTPTKSDALNAVQSSLSKCWNAGEPKQQISFYNIPITDANGNTIGSIRVDGTTGAITAAFPMQPIPIPHKP